MNEILYDGAGNLFRMIDGRGSGILPSAYEGEKASRLCLVSDGTKTDGLIVLFEAESDGYDFSMHYFNNDGTGGAMCGNGGRCVVSFARDLGIVPAAEDGRYRFTSAGNSYCGEILQDNGSDKTVKLQMADVRLAGRVDEPGLPFGNGCPHYVTFLGAAEELENLDIVPAAYPWRHSPLFPTGANVDFVAAEGSAPGSFAIRTFERGVEAETLACGTGIVASSISAALDARLTGTLHFDFRARGGNLSVDLTIPAKRTPDSPVATDIYLTGPTRRH